MVRAVLGRKHSTGRGWKDKQAVGGLAFRGGYGALSWDRRSLEIGRGRPAGAVGLALWKQPPTGPGSPLRLPVSPCCVTSGTQPAGPRRQGPKETFAGVTAEPGVGEQESPERHSKSEPRGLEGPRHGVVGFLCREVRSLERKQGVRSNQSTALRALSIHVGRPTYRTIHAGEGPAEGREAALYIDVKRYPRHVK